MTTEANRPSPCPCRPETARRARCCGDAAPASGCCCAPRCECAECRCANGCGCA